jgi:hypothetical protein
MKVIFLDHDGVICLHNNWGSRFKKREEDPFRNFDNFDKKSIKVLNRILVETDAEIVISSDWKYSSTLEEMRNFYRHQGILKAPIDFTPKIEEIGVDQDFPQAELEISRVREIKSWLSSHPEVIEWVAVDDLYLGDPEKSPAHSRAINSVPEKHRDFLSNFVHTKRPTEGIKQLGVEKTILSFLTNVECEKI